MRERPVNASAVLVLSCMVGAMVAEASAASCPVTALVSDGSTASGERAPNLKNRFGRTHYLILQSEMAAAGIAPGTQFSAIGWTFQTAPGLAGSNNLIVYMENTSDTMNNKNATWSMAISSMTVVHNAATTIPNVTGSFDIPLSAGNAFTYTGGGLYVAFDAQYPVGTLSTTTVVSCNSTGLPSGLKGAQSNAAPPATLATNSFRPETRLTATAGTVQNDASVDTLVAYGSLPRDLVGPQAIQATVTNHGGSNLTNLPVTLNVTGAQSFTDTQIVPSLASCGGQATVTFAPFTPAPLGSDTLTVSVPQDDVPSNDSKSEPLNVTAPDYSLKYPGTTPSGGLGVATATAELVGQFTTTNATVVTAVTLEFAAAGTQTYRVEIRADSVGTPGALLYLDAADRTVAVAGPVTITLPNVVAVGPGAFYVGIEQTAAVSASLSFDTEIPIRSGKIFGAVPIGGAFFDFAPGNNFKINVGVILDPCAGGAALCDDGDPCTDDACNSQTGCAHAPRNCDDGQDCTIDGCDPATGQCQNTQMDCSDGDPCTSDGCVSVPSFISCVHTPNPAPGEATNLRGTKIGSSTIGLVWDLDPSATRYDVVSGVLSALPVGPGGEGESCVVDDAGSPAASDATVPAVGGGRWYLSRDENACGDGPYGFQGLRGSPSTPRSTTTCP